MTKVSDELLRHFAAQDDQFDSTRMARELLELRANSEIFEQRAERWHLMFDAAIDRLVHIRALMHPADTVPPEALVRETWEALSKAIRAIPEENAVAPEAEKPAL